MNIFLFHRDLRLIDNTSLIHQLKDNKTIIPIFIFPPEQINPRKNKYFSHNSVQFMIESLHELSDDIKNKSGKMYFFKGDTMTVLKDLNKIESINSIGFNLDYTPYAKKRDKEIIDWCNDNNIKCYTKEDYALYDMINNPQTNKADNTPYLVFTPFYNHCINNLTVRPVDKYNSFHFTKISKLEDSKYYINEKSIDDFYQDNPSINVHGGRKNGLKILNQLDKFKDYEKKRDILTYNTTFLSAHNKFSTISIREEYHKMASLLGKKSGLIRELHWRDFYLNVVHNFPHILQGQIKGKNKSLKPEYDKLKWSYNKKLFQKWCDGQTGFPVVDAAMIQLNTIGYMHNRMRMVTSSFLTKTLHISWLMGEQYFANKLIDYEPTMNNQGWQWSTGNGADPQPYFRIFNPWTQAIKYDPDCEYIKKWIPELKNVSNKDILDWGNPDVHNKWIKSGVKYYSPVVEYDKERVKTLSIYKKALKH